MRWLKHKLRNWINSDDIELSSAPCLVNEGISHDYGEPFRFTISKANGGTIVSTTRYTRKTDRNDGDVYIITDEQNLPDEVGKIVSMEMLKF